MAFLFFSGAVPPPFLLSEEASDPGVSLFSILSPLSFGMISPFLHSACLPLPPLPLQSPLRRRGRLDEILLAHRSETVEAVKSRRGDPRRQISSSRGRTHDGAYVTRRNRK